jgi:hypothetical protein
LPGARSLTGTPPRSTSSWDRTVSVVLLGLDALELPAQMSR